MPGVAGEVDSLAVGKEQCVIVGAVDKPLRGIESLDQATLRALVSISLSGIDQAGSNENDQEERQHLHCRGSLEILFAILAKIGEAISPP